MKHASTLLLIAEAHDWPPWITTVEQAEQHFKSTLSEAQIEELGQKYWGPFERVARLIALSATVELVETRIRSDPRLIPDMITIKNLFIRRSAEMKDFFASLEKRI